VSIYTAALRLQLGGDKLTDPRRWEDLITAVIGAIVVLSPFGFTAAWTEPVAWAAYILGGLILVVAVVTLIWPRATFFEWAQVGSAFPGRRVISPAT
jgi:predicted permease